MSSAAFSRLIPLTVRGLQQPDVTNVGDVNKIRDDDMQMYSNSNPATNTPPLRSFYPHTTVAAPLQPVSPYATASLLQNNAAPMSESSSSPSLDITLNRIVLTRVCLQVARSWDRAARFDRCARQVRAATS